MKTRNNTPTTSADFQALMDIADEHDAEAIAQLACNDAVKPKPLQFETKPSKYSTGGSCWKTQVRPVIDNSYDVVPIKHKKKRPIVKDWPKTDFTAQAQIIKYSQVPYGIGIKTASTPAIDIDVHNPEMVKEIARLVNDRLGRVVMVRMGKHPKILIPCQIEGDVFSKLRSGKYIDLKNQFDDRGNAIIHQVEILASGQQFVAYGMHPDTGEPYKWGGSDPANMPYDKLPMLSKAKSLELIGHVNELFIQRGFTQVTPGSTSTTMDTVDIAHLQVSEVAKRLTAEALGISNDLELGLPEVDYDDAQRAKLIDAIRHIDFSKFTRDDCIRIIAGAKRGSIADAQMLKVLDMQAAKDNERGAKGYQEGFIQGVWDSIDTGDHNGPNGGAGLGVVYQTAGKHGWDEFAWEHKTRAVTSDEKSHTNILMDIVTLSSGGYYDLRLREPFKNAKALDSYYGHLRTPRPGADGARRFIPPSKQLEHSHRKKVAYALCWQPVRVKDYKEIITLDGHKMVNTFTPPKIIPAPGDVSMWLDLVNHICGQYADYLLDHMAFTVQHPDQKIRWQVLIVGAPRTGKTSIIEPLVNMLGSMALTIGSDELQRGWGDTFAKRKVLHVEEVYGFDGRLFNQLKPKFANSSVEELNMKGSAPVYQQNLYSMYMLTNHLDAFKMRSDEDKLLVIEAPDSQIHDGTSKNKYFYDTFGKHKTDTTFLQACMHYLLNRDVTQFSYGALPVRTAAMMKMCDAAKSDYAQWLEEHIEAREAPFDVWALRTDDIKRELNLSGYQCGNKGIACSLRDYGWRKVKAQHWNGRANSTVRIWVPQRWEHKNPGWLYKLFTARRKRR